MAERPTIVFVDDNVDELGPLSQQVQAANATSQVLFPSDVDLGILKVADLVVVDYTLDEWINDVEVKEISLRPLNGIALAAVLREHSTHQKQFPPTGFALISGKPGAFGPLPAERRAHVISRLNNVEWFFEKGANQSTTAAQIVSLANAIRSLPESVGTHLSTIDALTDFLGVSASPLRLRYRDAVERCRPPVHHLAERSHGLVILRWLLHRVLPHTSFLFDDFHVAARLGVTFESFTNERATDFGLLSMLSPFRYMGPLCDFDGDRWWRDGIEQLLWDITDGQSADSESVFRALEAGGCKHLEKTSVVRPVATLDHTLKRETAYSSRDDVIPLFLDDWPSYAEPAYARTDTIKEHEEMRMYVVDTTG